MEWVCSGVESLGPFLPLDAAAAVAAAPAVVAAVAELQLVRLGHEWISPQPVWCRWPPAALFSGGRSLLKNLSEILKS